jgi:hypothetical protein
MQSGIQIHDELLFEAREDAGMMWLGVRLQDGNSLQTERGLYRWWR